MRRERLVSIGLLVVAAVLLSFALRRILWPAKNPASSASSRYSIIAAPFPAGGIRGRVVVGSALAASLARMEPPPPVELGCGPRAWVLGSALLDAVVSIDGVTGGVAPANPEPELKLGACGFEPRISAGIAGGVARVRASPEHRVQGWVGGVRVFDAAKEGTVKVTLLDEGVWHLRCAAGHPWEQAWVRASAHPYHSVTDAKGRFRLEHVPAGTWTVRVWHPSLGEESRTVEVTASETAEIEWAW